MTLGLLWGRPAGAGPLLLPQPASQLLPASRLLAHVSLLSLLFPAYPLTPAARELLGATALHYFTAGGSAHTRMHRFSFLFGRATAAPAGLLPAELPVGATALQYLTAGGSVGSDGSFGCDWSVSSTRWNVSVGASVPGDLLSDLQRAGVIADPWYELNFLNRTADWQGCECYAKRPPATPRAMHCPQLPPRAPPLFLAPSSAVGRRHLDLRVHLCRLARGALLANLLSRL